MLWGLWARFGALQGVRRPVQLRVATGFRELGREQAELRAVRGFRGARGFRQSHSGFAGGIEPLGHVVARNRSWFSSEAEANIKDCWGTFFCARNGARVAEGVGIGLFELCAAGGSRPRGAWSATDRWTAAASRHVAMGG